MNCTRPRRHHSYDPAEAYDRRVRAAWLDYLETTRSAPRRQYADIEQNAWLRLQRRLQRNQQRFPNLARSSS